MESILLGIKNAGFRLTAVRKAMVKIFFENGCLLTSSDIHVELSKLCIKADRTTIYREVQFLLEKKIIRKIQIGDDKTYYEISTGHHHHLVCNKCNGIKEVILGQHLEDQEKKIYKKEKFKVLSHSLEFYGLCDKCV
jgi:Fur family transcriptional regulator, ferric uptake regulator